MTRLLSERFVLTGVVPYNRGPINHARTAMNRVQLDIARYCAWAPGVESMADWQRWAHAEQPIADDGSPAVEFLPPLFRRRLSRVSRMALQVAHDCVGVERDLPTVFCSRHGELTRTVELLQDQLRGEPLSPTAFSMSVHNTAAGLYTIASGNTAPSNAVAAMADSLPVALVDAAAAIASGRIKRIMVVVAEEPASAPYRAFLPAEFAYAAAFLLVADAAAPDQDTTRLSLTFSAAPTVNSAVNGAANDASDDAEQQGLALLRFLLRQEHRRDGAQPLVLTGERLQWTFAAS